MNIQKLKEAEKYFFAKFPGGFENPEMLKIGKKHKMDKLIGQTQEFFAKENFKEPEMIVEKVTKVVSRSSMVSLFEKPKFRDFAMTLPIGEKELLAKGVKELLHGNQKNGFEIILEILKNGKLAKWTLMTVLPIYLRPQIDVFVKPTYAKKIIEIYELESLTYKPTPSWEFYESFREQINEMKTKVDPSLSNYNAAFTGFLIMGSENLT
ncbi:MAG: hypothetical protein DWQ06_01655 [Calditrichaeota bacterium]|nr:MAG: hypothetical protein DWQ06_01655 [Calditrichota bacterium]